MNQIIPFHYLISMSLDDGLIITSVQKASKKRKEKKNYDGKKIRHASTRTPFLHTFSSLFLSFFFNITRSRMWVNFPPFAIQDQGDFIPPFHAWVGPWLFWQDILCGIHGHIPQGRECWRMAVSVWLGRC